MITPKITNLGYSNLWTDMSTILGYASNFQKLITKLFANGEQGFFYDPSDMGTMFQDAAGTIPVTAAGQPVGLILDKSGRNNHAFQSVSASRPILQQTPIMGSEIITNGDFSNGTTGWIGNAATLTVSDGKLCVTSTGGGASARYSIPTAVGKTYIVSLELIRGTTPNSNQLRVGSTGGNNDVLNISIGTTSATKTVQFVAVSAITYLSIGYGESGAGQTSYWDNVTVKEITGYRTDQNYLAFDGVDDFLQTNSIDFTTTDKVSLFAGVRKLSDATIGTVLELSASKNTNNGVFALFAPLDGGVTQMAWISKGTAERAAFNNTIAAPITTVISAKGSISGGVSTLKVNGTQIANSLDQGTGNYGNYPLYIGRRAGISLPFNGHLYSLIGIGRLTTDSETKALEKSIAKNTGVTLNV